MWFSRISLIHSVWLASLISIHASPNPLSTSASTTATIEGPRADGSTLLIHVLRTEDLIADQLDKKPLLLEKSSHLVIRVQLGNDTVSVNGHSLPVLPQDDKESLEIKVKLDQVQMLKLPKDSPLVPLGLSSPELLKISDKYMSEGLVGAILSVSQEPLTVEAMRGDGKSIPAKAFKVTIGIKILEIGGLALEQTNLPPVDLLHLIVHPDPADPTKVATMTTIAPEELSKGRSSATSGGLAGSLLSGAGFPGLSNFPHPSDLFGAALAATSASLDSALEALGKTAGRLASHATGLLQGSGHRHHHGKPCPGRKHHRPHHHSGHAAHHAAAHPAVPAVAQHLEAAQVSPKSQHAFSFSRALRCLVKMVTRSSLIIFVIAIPVVFLSLIFSFIRGTAQRKRQAARQAQYKAVSTVETVDELEKAPVVDVIVVDKV